MGNIIGLFDWRPELANMPNVESIGDDFILLNKPIISSIFEYPFKVDVVTAIIYEKGEMKGKMDLKPYHSKGAGMIIIMPDQILEYEYISPDFSGMFIVMSKRFVGSLGIEDTFSTFVSVRDNPCIPLGSEGMEAMQIYYTMMQRAISVKDHPNRLEIAKNLTRALFYGVGFSLHKASDDKQKSKHEMLVDHFVKLVQVHYKHHRRLEFYADKLCITPKYMSTIIKQTSGKAAGEWIDDYVMLEGKALLKSTNMTIQQISDELNFPSQSFFGKYFKRLVGVSPKEYRKS
ncbi:MAG: AraC family transcriptional regulator [Tannerellaceae bacterium]|jgi:AraC-like DNA-binding protein|nr:AraC family transcriptional regulator [Tannerellaceae bacterium]